MRNIKEFAQTTPTYVYNISDAVTAGLELDKMAIGMAIVFGTATDQIYYIFGERPTIMDLSDGTALIEAYYATHIDKTNTFVLNVPLWRIASKNVGESGQYQIFLYQKELYSVGTTKEDGTGNPDRIPPRNVVIDYGAFTLLDRLAPEILGAAKRDDTLVLF